MNEDETFITAKQEIDHGKISIENDNVEASPPARDIVVEGNPEPEADGSGHVKPSDPPEGPAVSTQSPAAWGEELEAAACAMATESLINGGDTFGYGLEPGLAGARAVLARYPTLDTVEHDDGDFFMNGTEYRALAKWPRPVNLLTAIARVEPPEETTDIIEGVQMPDVSPVKLGGDFRDLAVVPVTSLKVRDKLRRCADTGKKCLVRGVIIPMRKNSKRKPNLLIVYADDQDRPTVYCRATRREIQDARDLLRRLRQDKVSFADAFRQELERIGFQFNGDIWRAALYAATLTALSVGVIEDESGRIHILFLGPPGSSKSILGKIASRLACVFREVRTIRRTEAGLHGGPYGPGTFEETHLGLVVLTDFAVNADGDARWLQGGLLEVLQNGRVPRNLASDHRTGVALTSVIIDSNTDLGDGRGRRNNLLFQPVISRLDCIYEFEAEPGQHDAVVNAVLHKTNGPATAKVDDSWAWSRPWQVAAAVLNEEIGSVDISRVQEHATALERELSNLTVPGGVGDVRSAISIHRLVIAESRNWQRSFAEPQDIDVVRRLLTPKFEYLRRVRDMLPGAAKNTPPNKPAARCTWYRKNLHGIFSVDDALAALRDQYHDVAVDRDTVQRDLKRMRDDRELVDAGNVSGSKARLFKMAEVGAAG
jgi:hypothetical protein